MAAIEESESAITKDITCKICNDVYTNAKDLSCGHTFCLTCLELKRPQRCPECNEESVPEAGLLRQLKANKEKNHLVGLEMSRRNNNEEADKRKHEGVVCNHCDKKDFSGIRYICGMCPSYNLCEGCEDKEHKHEKTHLFIKLKKPASKPVPEGPILNEIAAEMGKEMDFDRSRHMVLEKVGPNTYKKLMSYCCDRCSNSKGEIKGVRYQCANCLNYDLCSSCEERSDVVHDPSHVYVKIDHSVNKVIEGAFKTPLLKHDLY